MLLTMMVRALVLREGGDGDEHPLTQKGCVCTTVWLIRSAHVFQNFFCLYLDLVGLCVVLCCVGGVGQDVLCALSKMVRSS